MPVLSTDTARLNGMPKPSAATTPFHLVYGGDSYLNDQTVRDLKHEAQRRYPDAETIELDAANADHYAFDEAVSPSLLADRAIVIVTNLQNADEKLATPWSLTADRRARSRRTRASSSASMRAV